MKFLYLGSNIHQSVLDVIINNSNTILVYEEEDIGLFKSSIEQLNRLNRAICISKSAIQEKRPGLVSYIPERERVISAVLNDFRVFLLRGRFLRVDTAGVFSGLTYFSDIVDFALMFLVRFSPKLAYCSYTPHTVEAWIFFRTLEESGVRIIRLISSPLPWINVPIVGLTQENMQLPSSKKSKSEDGRNKVKTYMSSLKNSYSEAMPYYEKPTFHDFWSNISSLSPKNIIKSYEKRKIYLEYLAEAKSFDSSISFAAYFLHYQPEMNTLPEAGLYCDQYQAIVKISQSLPQGVRLLVKEHPSTFSKRSDRRWRPYGFYNRISSISNVDVCPPDLDTFQIIDKAKFIASIAGVCLTEALARKKVAVTFFPVRFSYFPNKLVVDAANPTVTELTETLKRVCASKASFSEQETIDCMEQVMMNGYDGSDNDSYIPQSIFQAATNSKKANYYAVQDIINEELV